MKKVLRILFVFTIIFTSKNYCQTEWLWVNPYPQGQRVNAIQFVNSNTGWFTGYSSVLFKTTNGGINWKSQIDGIANGFLDLCFINENTGLVCGTFGVVLKTSNGGVIWSELPTNITTDLSSIEFYNLSTGFAVGNAGKILKTTNGGNNWIQQNLSSNIDLSKIQIMDSSNAVISGHSFNGSHYYGYFIKTTNGGNNWSITTVLTSEQLISSNCIAFIDKNIGFITGRGITAKTTNGGINWNAQSIGGDFDYIQFVNDSVGYKCTSYSIFKTTNRGENWVNNYQVSGNRAECMSFFDENNGWIGGWAGMLSSTSNGGSNWLIRSSNVTTLWLYDCKFHNNIGFIGGGGTILKTSNSGKNWVTKSNSQTNSLQIIDSLNIVATGGNNAIGSNIRKSENGGETWFTLYTSNPGSPILNSIIFFNLNTGCVLGDQILLRTTNGGLNWSSINSNSTSYKGSYKVDSLVGFAVGLNGACLITTNAGETWSTQVTGVSNSLFSVSFINSNTGWISGSGSTILKTTNSGKNWFSVSLASSINLYSIHFINEYLGFTVGNDGTYSHIFRTTNGGMNWYRQSFSSNWPIFGVHIQNENNVWVVGYLGSIIKSTNSGITFKVNEKNFVPSNHILEQNYPNPFNPTTKIQFDIPKTGNASLKVFDILGKEVATLVNENLQPGTYETTFDGSMFTSGVYFYRLQTDDYTETKRMTLIK